MNFFLWNITPPAPWCKAASGHGKFAAYAAAIKRKTDASLYADERCRHTEKMYLQGDQSSAFRVSTYDRAWTGTAAIRRTKEVMKHEAILKWISQRRSTIEVGTRHHYDEKQIAQ